MVTRRFWLNCIHNLWKEKNVIWLTGVRRCGKTCLCQTLDNAVYYDCEISHVRREMADSYRFLESLPEGRPAVFDEIHRLDNPSELLKLAADYFPKKKIVATGSSSLGASRRFKDTLTGRKKVLRMTPMLLDDQKDFGSTDLDRRLLYGGLPPFFLAPARQPGDYADWMDDFWAKDIQELFRFREKHSFQKFTELLFVQSGRMFEATRFAAPCEVGRSTIAGYLAALEETHVAYVLRPLGGKKSGEIVSAPKVYGFDTGFVAYHNGWNELRPDDRGILWEHFVLNELFGRLQLREAGYWRDKRGHEIDFVLKHLDGAVDAIECKWSADAFSPENLSSFRSRHAKGDNYVVCADVPRPYSRTMRTMPVKMTTIDGLIESLSKDSATVQ